MKYLTLFLLLLSGCATDSSIRLEWDIENSPKVSYKVARYKLADENVLGVSGFDLLNDPKLTKIIVEKIANYEVGDNAHMLMKLSPTANGQLRLHLTTKEFPYLSPPNDDNEKSIRDSRKELEGTTELITDITKSGKPVSISLKHNAKNFVTALMTLPELPVGKNSQWSIPVSFLSFSAPFQLNSSDRINQVRLIDLSKDAANNTIATIFYNITDRVSGENILDKGKTIQPIDMEVSYLSVGEFVIEKNYWQRYRAFRITKYSKSVQRETTEVYALDPM